MQAALFDAIPRYSVSELTKRIRAVLEMTPDLQEVWVQGEISNLARPSSGHLYFTLKDPGAQLRCVIWRNDAARLQFVPVDGLSVEARGSISLYEAGGQYQLYVVSLRPVGEGALYAEFLRLKALLEKEGLFDPARKRPIPELPKKIGIVTSPTGAALRDMLNTITRRFPLTEVFLAPTLVQGDGAPAAIVAALKGLNRLIMPDVILLARGGGSIEDLWSFNNEMVVREVASSHAPVITGVGHETDFTLADFAADRRAPTPTAAAELATPVTMVDLQATLSQLTHELVQAMQSILEGRKETFTWMNQQFKLVSPVRRLQGERQRLDEINRRLVSAQVHGLTISRAMANGLKNRLEALNPTAVLQRGYAFVTRKENGDLVLDPSQIHPGEEVSVRVSKGTFDAQVLGG